jgi:hypothetical protein
MAARGAAAAPAGGDPLAALPHALALAIFSRLTVEQRLRCIEVCRGWRATLNDHSAWLQLDLTRADGGECSEALLRAATSRAGGQLRSLRLACGDELHGALCAVAAGNAATLQELRVSAPGAELQQLLKIEDLEVLLRAAPQLRTLEADVDCEDAADAHRVLCNEPPFGPLRVRQLRVWGRPDDTVDVVFALAADMATHASLASISLDGVPLHDPVVLDAVVDAALARRLSSVRLNDCHLSRASAAALARLLRGDTLTELHIYNSESQLLDAPAATLLANALRANTSLTALSLERIELWRDAAVAAELMGALTAHPRLRMLGLSSNDPHDGGLQAAEAGAMLAALLLANAPALQSLDISYCELGDAGVGPVVEALRHNTHLTKLNCRDNAMSAEFARDVLFPAVRANASLRELLAAEQYSTEDEEDDPAAAQEAEALVAARAQPE